MTRQKTSTKKTTSWCYQDLMQRFSIQPKYRQDYVAIVETGEASPEFTSLLDNNPQWQQAVELGLARRIEHIRQVLSSC